MTWFDRALTLLNNFGDYFMCITICLVVCSLPSIVGSGWIRDEDTGAGCDSAKATGHRAETKWCY